MLAIVGQLSGPQLTAHFSFDFSIRLFVSSRLCPLRLCAERNFMTPRARSRPDAAALRRSAEAQVMSQPPPSPPLPQADMQRLQHELEVH